MKNAILIVLFFLISLFSYSQESDSLIQHSNQDLQTVQQDSLVSSLNETCADLKEDKNNLMNELKHLNIKLASVGAFWGLTLAFMFLFLFLFLRLRSRYRIDTEELKAALDAARQKIQE